MYLWFTTTIPVTTTFITSITGSITIASVLLSCAVRKSKRPYKPGHLPEFVDPSTKEADTYYGMRSTIAFPVKGIKIKRKHDLKEQQARADIELNPETKNRNDLDGRIQLGSIPIRENSKPPQNKLNMAGNAKPAGSFVLFHLSLILTGFVHATYL